MAGPFDLTGQNIENTYQRVLQTPDGATFYDGTGSLVTLPSANTASLLTTASATLNVIQFTKGDGSTFNVTVDTGSGGTINTSGFVTTSSFNAFTSSINQFTSSYNTGSFSGSFTGSFNGTASWAQSASQAITASYYKETDPIFTAVSGTFVLTSSFNSFTSSINTFTASYNTGSFTGSFSGSFYGTASWATNAQTASYVLQAISASFASNGGVTQLLAGPNITLSPTNGLGQVTITSTGGGGSSFNTATGSYGSFYSTVTQTNVASTARSMSLNTTDISNGVSISGSTNPFNTYIKTENPGVYDIQFSAQVDKTDSGTDEIWIWLRKNGVNVTDSATSIQLVGNGAHYVAAWNFFVNAAANDYFQLIWYSPDPNVRLHAEAGFGVVPGIPSLIVTVNRVDQFLSNTGSFSGSFAGSLLGTASWAESASQALTASFVRTAQTASYVLQAVSASFATTSSFALTYPYNSTSSVIGNGLSSSFNINHGFNTRNLHITVYNSASGDIVYPDLKHLNANTSSVIFANPPSSSQYIVYISQ
jgi:hypothetical protein